MQNIYNIKYFIIYNKLNINCIFIMKNQRNTKFKSMRIANNLSQQELSDKLDATRQTIGLI